MKKRNYYGFTLAELLIVVAIIAVLVAISIPIFTGQLEKAKQATDLANMRSAKAAAVAEYLTENMGGEYKRYYDAGKGRMSDSIPEGYGKSSKDVTAFDTVIDGASGVPNSDGTAHYITVSIDKNGTVLMNWNGRDLTTVAGRKKADVDNMQAIAQALIDGVDDGTIQLQKNFVCVAVLPSGKILYYMDNNSNDHSSEENISTIKAGLEKSGINTDIYEFFGSDNDTKWKNGYVVMYDKNAQTNKISYRWMSSAEAREGKINWWGNNKLTEEDMN